MWCPVSHLRSHVVPNQSSAQSSGAPSVICTVVWCCITCLYSPQLFYQSHARTYGALSVTPTNMWCLLVICTILPLVLNPDLLVAVLASPFANKARKFIIDLLLPLPSAFASAFAFCLLPLPLTLLCRASRPSANQPMLLNSLLSIPGAIAAGQIAFPCGTFRLSVGHSLPFHALLSAFP